MDLSPRENFILQLTGLLDRISDEKALKFLKSLYEVYHSTPRDRFTLDNLTHREKEDLNNYAATAVINVIRRIRSRRDLSFFLNIGNEREILSGLVFLRLEFIPMCYELKESHWHPLQKWIEKSIDVEAVLKRAIGEHYENGRYQGKNEEGPDGHYWWSTRRIEDEGREFALIRWNNVDQLELELRDDYKLAD